MDENISNIIKRTVSFLLGVVALWQCYLIYASRQFLNLLKSFELQHIFVDLLQVMQMIVPIFFLLTLVLAVYIWGKNKLNLGVVVLVFSIVLLGTLFAQLAIQAVGYIPILLEDSA